MAKTYKVLKHGRYGRDNVYEGTIKELVSIFSHTLECGHSWNYSIPTQPRTYKSLINALNNSVLATQGACYNRDYYEAIN